jgi:hypothetical protein
VHFPKADVREVMGFYGLLVRKPVLMDVNMQAVVTVDQEQELSVKDAVELIRKTLLESYGIQMRESDRGEVLVTWSTDPKYPPQGDGVRQIDGHNIQRRRIQLEPAESK